MNFLKLLFIILLVQFATIARSQPTYYSTYTNSVGSTDFSSSSAFTKALDGTYVGLVNDSNFIKYSLIKVDELGNIKWRKIIMLPELANATRAITLTDSSIAFLFITNSQIISGLVLKVSNNGIVKWCKSYEAPSSSSLLAIEPLKYGGMVITGSGCPGFDIDIRIDSNGTIFSQKTHVNFNTQLDISALDMIHEGNSTITKWGFCPGIPYPNCGMALYNVDSLGENSNVQVIQLVGETIYTIQNLPNKILVKSTSGGYFAICGSANTSSTGASKWFYLFYFDHNKNLSWVNKISCNNSSSQFLFDSRFINATSDNGCIVSTRNVFNSNQNIAAYDIVSFIKFDSVGVMQWCKSLGDTSNSNWDYIEQTAFLPAQNNGWFSCFSRNNNIDIARIDDQFNSFCNYHNFIPTITPVQFTVFTDQMISLPIHFNVNSYVIPQIDTKYERFNECSTVDVPESRFENLSRIYPNPASQYIHLPEESVQIDFINLLGENVKHVFYPSENEDVSSLPNGIYLVQIVKKENEILKFKLIVTR